jgi:ATP phosphoribosyltransferase regulatory subunit HisZ
VPEPPPPAPAPTPPIIVRKVTTSKFAWRVTTDLKGDRSLQIGDASPTLSALVSALGTNQRATDALTAFLEDLDRLDLQQALLDDAVDP